MVGLGNPGAEYAGSRHNVGADVVALIAERHAGVLALSKRERSLTGSVRLAGAQVLLAFPQTFMNDSGQAVRLLARRHEVADPVRLIVVHDELDLAPAVVRVKEGGGLAGHNGLRSIRDHLHTDAFLRVRIGIGKPPGGKDRGADHVLKRVPAREREEMAVAIEEAADAVEMIVGEGSAKAMNRYNRSRGD